MACAGAKTAAGGITGVTAAKAALKRVTLANSACSRHIFGLTPAVALPAPRHDRRRTGAAGSPPGGFPLCAERMQAGLTAGVTRGFAAGTRRADVPFAWKQSALCPRVD